MSASSLFVRGLTAFNLDLLAANPGLTAREFGRRRRYHINARSGYSQAHVAAAVLRGLQNRGLVFSAKQQGIKCYYLTELGVHSLFNYHQEYLS